MSRIRGKNTKPELLVRKYLYSKGLRYRLHTKLPGKPDIVIRKAHLAIFINGCFWHGHEGCIDSRLPKSNVSFWERKLGDNKARDICNQRELETAGFRVIIVWECQLKGTSKERTLNGLYREIRTYIPFT